MISNIHIPSARRLISIIILVVVINSTTAKLENKCNVLLNCVGFTGSYHTDILKKSDIDDVLKTIKPFQKDMPKEKLYSTKEMLNLLNKHQESEEINKAKNILNECSSSLEDDNWVDIFQFSLHYLKTIEQLNLLNIFQGAINQIAYELLNNMDNSSGSSKNTGKINDMLKAYWANFRGIVGEYTESFGYKNAYCKSIVLTGGEENSNYASQYFILLLPTVV
uniref:Uncharacterized protein n=1 Tax=Schizaphis graminum TaxID=13262 RepID=A0A2S2PQE9_SCHGA